jgi:uncharacterized protein YgbK (DUF1537 family)
MKKKTPLQIGIVGDDLTGVNALAAEAVNFGFSVYVTRSAAPPDRPASVSAVWGINLGCRETTEAENREATFEAIGRLKSWGADRVIIKIDSSWRGYPDAMIEAALEHGKVTAVSPYAANARLKKQAEAGRLHVVPESNPFLILNRLRADCAVGVYLWAGSVGLCQSILWALLKRPLPVAVVIGSYQSVVDEQVKALSTMGAAQFNLMDLFGIPIDKAKLETIRDTIWEAWRNKGIIVLRTANPVSGASDQEISGDPIGLSSDTASATAEAFFNLSAELFRDCFNRGDYGLVLTGGHTADVVLKHLGGQVLRLIGPPPIVGAPIAEIVDGPFAGSLVATKPGRFGGADALVQLIMTLQLHAFMRD